MIGLGPHRRYDTLPLSIQKDPCVLEVGKPIEDREIEGSWLREVKDCLGRRNSLLVAEVLQYVIQFYFSADDDFPDFATPQEKHCTLVALILRSVTCQLNLAYSYQLHFRADCSVHNFPNPFKFLSALLPLSWIYRHLLKCSCFK